MTDAIVTVRELALANAEPQVEVTLTREDQQVFQRVARLFSEDDVIQMSDEIVRVAGLNQVDVEQSLATRLMPMRIRVLRQRDGVAEGDPEPEQPPAPPRYVAELPSTTGDGPREAALRDVLTDRVLANFVLVLEEEVEVQDDFESFKEFVGSLTIGDRKLPFRIRARDFADGKKLWAAITETAGCSAVRYCGMDELSRAISTISPQAAQIRRRKLTTNLGWTVDSQSYLTPSLRISRAGIEVLDSAAEVRVDLGTETPGCHLDLKLLALAELVRVKRHIVEDLLALNIRVATHTLLGATAAAVLYPFAPGAGRFALWLVGQSGAGKSFLAKHFMNFFGDFPVSSGHFTPWSATPNFVQRQGYFFKDALYLVDDYKPEVVQPYQVVRVLQTYADGTARGRLKSDATANVMRPIRGLLYCTGEDVPEHNASAIARSVIVHMPQLEKNMIAGRRCLVECKHYAGVMADFIRWLLVQRRAAVFSSRFAELQDRYYADIAGQQNDIRIATNLALLGASFEQFAEYLADVWPQWREAARAFVEEELVTIRADMLGEAKEQQASEVFLRTLADLIRFNHVRIDGLRMQRDGDHKPMIGRVSGNRGPGPMPGAGQRGDSFEICTSLALAQVNASLRQQGRAELKITERALLQQLREDGKLLGADGEKLDPRVNPTSRVRLEGNGQVRAFAISQRELLGE